MNFERNANESEYHYIWRIYSHFDNGGRITDTDKVGQICNKALKVDYDESRHRKIYESFNKVWKEVRHEFISEESLLEQLEEMDEKEEKLYKQQVKTADKKREYRQLLRDDARIENLISTIQNVALSMDSFDYSGKICQDLNKSRTAILNIGDWHLGKKFKHILNEYNKLVAKDRVDKLLFEVQKYCETFNVGTLYVAGLGDFIEGALRVTARVTSEEDTIQQVMSVSELIAFLLNGLSEFGLDVKYLSVLDNHSRLTPNFREHIEKENFGHLIDWYLQSRLDGKVEFLENKIDENIGYLEIDGKIHVFVHGHIKAHAINVIVQNMVAIIGVKPDYVHVGHWHSSHQKEILFSKIFTNGSLCGVDDYAFSQGYYSKPSQSLIIIDGETDIKIDINL